MSEPIDMASGADQPARLGVPRGLRIPRLRRSLPFGLWLLIGACGAAPMRSEAPPPLSRAPASRPLREETLASPDGDRERSRPDLVAAPPEPAATPDPQAVLASIGPSTSPQRAASLRLTDEGRRLFEAGDLLRALDRIETGLKVDASNPHAYYWLAQVHYQSGRLDQALAFSDKSIVLFTGEQSDWLAQAYTFRASILERSGRFRDARESYRRAVQMQPGSVAARAGLARLGEPTAGRAAEE